MSGESTSHVVGSPRRLAAILAADISGYSRLMGSDEEGTLARLKRHRREIVEPTIQEHYGRLIKTTGDGFLAMFDSPLEAVRCAIVIQQSMAARNTSLPPEQWIRYRIGVNLGDVIVDSDDIYGEGVNIAARLENLADPGGVFISGGVYEQIKNKLVCGYQSLGDEKLKNITDPVRIYRVLPDPAAVAKAAKRHWFWATAGAALLLILGGVGWSVMRPELSIGARRTAVSERPAAGSSAPVPAPTPAEPAQPEPAAARAAVDTLPGMPPVPPPSSGTLPIPIVPTPPAPAGGPTVAAIPPPPAKPADAGGALRDCQGCPELVRIPAGSFRMGSDEDPSEKPVHTVQVAAFALGRYPVTVAEWNRCVAAKACPDVVRGEDTDPARNLSWLDAQQYVTWLARTTGLPYRLPSEAEWEYAARAGSTGRYWWGERMAPRMANCKGCGDPYDPHQPLKVGSLAQNPFGVSDLSGGVAQWVADCWHPTYQGAPTDGSAWAEPNCREHVLRGGSWRNDASYARSASRMHYDTGVRYPAHGLRVARPL
ncbi:SUMF1/EgtB/PvdO family nonheme iron enzyme [Microvirga thermotolerans]|uniref:SUMF1/EgtB/PvdO family nonheme iron enzyme n=1 Tax=Microvirga thermotolerans TaxID=2651334 RepID=A0A5P9K041_9HYPH|nr:SUMF1/EgtB/PvdO family nonheme iron enzyme [Microvirga thermotolerans]QFU17899.1 SUMF1/EgtB/PvdO family nonheme iron enzyme [Microvirga thermotolerans]